MLILLRRQKLNLVHEIFFLQKESRYLVKEWARHIGLSQGGKHVEMAKSRVWVCLFHVRPNSLLGGSLFQTARRESEPERARDIFRSPTR